MEGVLKQTRIERLALTDHNIDLVVPPGSRISNDPVIGDIVIDHPEDLNVLLRAHPSIPGERHVIVKDGATGHDKGGAS